jgi:alpha-galactosidase
MSNPAKIVFVGATSRSFGLSMLRDICSSRELSGCTFTLVGRNQETLARMGGLARMLNERWGTGLTIEHTTDRRAALDGAHFVINATAVDRLRMWKLDFEIPRKHGIRHSLGENGGPGGLFFTLRTLPLVFDIIREMEELCPHALFINLSNPESRIILALGKHSKIRALGLCHGIFMGQRDVARIMDLPPAQVAVWGAGLNHFQWLLQIRDQASGEDLYPRLRQMEQRHEPSFAPLSRQLLRAFGYWPSCSDHHLGEYLAYGWEAGETGYDFTGEERDRDELDATLDRVVSRAQPVPADWLTPSGERAGSVIGAILRGEKRFIESGIVYNQRIIPNLPEHAAIEVPILVDAAGVHPVSLGALPDAIAKLLCMQVGVQQLAVEAAVYASKEIALRALLIDPVVNSTKAALGLLQELWEANRPYIRKCI